MQRLEKFNIFLVHCTRIYFPQLALHLCINHSRVYSDGPNRWLLGGKSHCQVIYGTFWSSVWSPSSVSAISCPRWSKYNTTATISEVGNGFLELGISPVIFYTGLGSCRLTIATIEKKLTLNADLHSSTVLSMIVLPGCKVPWFRIMPSMRLNVLIVSSTSRRPSTSSSISP